MKINIVKCNFGHIKECSFNRFIYEFKHLQIMKIKEIRIGNITGEQYNKTLRPIYSGPVSHPVYIHYYLFFKDKN